MAKKLQDIPILTKQFWKKLGDETADRIRVHTTKGGKDVIAVDILVGGISVRGREVDYATAVHEGYTDARSGVKHAARPWLATAVRLHASGFESRLKKAVKIYGSK